MLCETVDSEDIGRDAMASKLQMDKSGLAAPTGDRFMSWGTCVAGVCAHHRRSLMEEEDTV